MEKAKVGFGDELLQRLEKYDKAGRDAFVKAVEQNLGGLLDEGDKAAEAARSPAARLKEKIKATCFGPRLPSGARRFDTNEAGMIIRLYEEGSYKAPPLDRAAIFRDANEEVFQADQEDDERARQVREAAV